MLKRCPFCRGEYPENDQLPHLLHGRRIAVDADRGRLWVVCGRCHRWTLAPLENRLAAIWEVEREAHDHGEVLASTARVTLLRARRLLLIRIGGAALVEQAWWRFGTELRGRRASYASRATRVAAWTYGAAQYAAEVLGFADPDVNVDWEDRPLTDILRWRKFGWAAWHGRERCPYCQSTLRALRYDLSWWSYPILGSDGRIGLGVPCSRCDPWTPDHIYRLEGARAERALRRVLAYQNIEGASERRIRDAAEWIDSSGSAGAFTEQLSQRRDCLWKLGATGTIALEIALSESVEQRMIDLEMGAIEHVWRREEELARIMDEELTPREVWEEHLRRLPIRFRPRRPPAHLAGRTG